MNEISKNNDQNAAYSEVLVFIQQELGQDKVPTYLDSIHIDVERNLITLVARDPQKESTIRCRLLCGIEEILQKYGIKETVQVIIKTSAKNNTYKTWDDESIFIEKVMHILSDYKFLGHVQLDGVDYVLVTSSDSSGKFKYLSVFEVETYPDADIDEYSFSIVDEAALIIKVLKELERNCTQEDFGGN